MWVLLYKKAYYYECNFEDVTPYIFEEALEAKG
jgi:hypothetical protein